MKLIQPVWTIGWCPYCSTQQDVVSTPEDEQSPYKLGQHSLGRSDSVCQGSGQEPGLRYATCWTCQTAVPATIQLAGDFATREMVQDWHPYEEWIFEAVLDSHPVCDLPDEPLCLGSGERGGYSYGIVALKRLEAA